MRNGKFLGNGKIPRDEKALGFLVMGETNCLSDAKKSVFHKGMEIVTFQNQCLKKEWFVSGTWYNPTYTHNNYSKVSRNATFCTTMLLSYYLQFIKRPVQKVSDCKYSLFISTGYAKKAFIGCVSFFFSIGMLCFTNLVSFQSI